jgi:hypothetical protein
LPIQRTVRPLRRLTHTSQTALAVPSCRDLVCLTVTSARDYRSTFPYGAGRTLNSPGLLRTCRL